MGFFSRLKWLLVGEGEAPSNFKSVAAPHGRRPDSHSQRGPAQSRDRNNNGPRDREGRDNRGDRYARDGRDSSRGPRGDSREPRDSRPPREPREPRDRDSQPRSPGFSRDGNSDHYAERDRGSHGPRRSGPQGNFSRRDSNSSDGNFPRPIDRPTGGPSSTMRPAQSSIQEVAPMPVIERPILQGPERVGVVSIYLEDVRMANIKMEKGSIRLGDWIEIQGNISSLRQKVDSIQLDNQPVSEAREGQDVNIRVIRPVKIGDVIVRLRG